MDRFAVLCKITEPSLTKDGKRVDCGNTALLKQVTIDMSRFLLEFFVQDGIMRPLTNSNLVLDFCRFRDSEYYTLFCSYLEFQQVTEYTQL